MNILYKGISYVGLLLTVVPSILLFSGIVELQAHKTAMLVGMLLWFITAPLWLNRKSA